MACVISFQQEQAVATTGGGAIDVNIFAVIMCQSIVSLVQNYKHIHQQNIPLTVCRLKSGPSINCHSFCHKTAFTN